MDEAGPGGAGLTVNLDTREKEAQEPNAQTNLGHGVSLKPVWSA